jgi:hypothetical protein
MEQDRNPNMLGDWSKYEGNRSLLYDWQLNLLEKWDSNRNPNEIFNVMKAIIPEFKRINKVLCYKLDISENTERINQVIELVE